MDEVLAYNFLLNNNINNIQSLSIVNKQNMEICNNNHFWIEKFKHDNLTFFYQPKTMKEWIDMYKMVNNSDKYSVRCAQLGTIGRIIDENDMPYLGEVTPDLIVKCIRR